MSFVTAPFIYGKNQWELKDIADHIISLPLVARQLRFFHAITDDGIRKYVEGTQDSTGFWFVASNSNGCVVAALHVAISDKGDVAEFGFSVDPMFQGRGIATSMVRLAIDRLKLLYGSTVRCVVFNCLSENIAVQKICRGMGFDVASVAYGEKEGTLKLDNAEQISPELALRVATSTFNNYWTPICLPFVQYVSTMMKVIKENINHCN